MRREKVRVTIMFCSIVLAGVAFASNARAECSREMLQKLTDTYVKAQTAGKATMLPLAPRARPTRRTTRPWTLPRACWPDP